MKYLLIILAAVALLALGVLLGNTVLINTSGMTTEQVDQVIARIDSLDSRIQIIQNVIDNNNRNLAIERDSLEENYYKIEQAIKNIPPYRPISIGTIDSDSLLKRLRVAYELE